MGYIYIYWIEGDIMGNSWDIVAYSWNIVGI